MSRLRPEADSLDTLASANAARCGVNCPVCGQWKRAGALLCHECMAHCAQDLRNRMAVSTEEYRAICRDLRTERQARLAGFKLLTANEEG
jgi:hypothetical protein